MITRLARSSGTGGDPATCRSDTRTCAPTRTSVPGSATAGQRPGTVDVELHPDLVGGDPRLLDRGGERTRRDPPGARSVAAPPPARSRSGAASLAQPPCPLAGEHGARSRGTGRSTPSAGCRQTSSSVPLCTIRPVAHHGHPVGHGERLLLVVRHQHRGRAGRAQDVVQVAGEALAQPAVQCAQRLVEEEQPRVDGECAGEGDPLALTSREGGRSAGRRTPRRPTSSSSSSTRARWRGRGSGAAAAAGRRCWRRRRGARTAGRPGTSARSRACGSVRRRGRARRTRWSRRPATSRPATARSSVDLPQPDGPSTATTEPAGTSRSTWSTATVAPKRTVRSLRPSVRPGRWPSQKAPIDPTRRRWTANITAAVVAASTTEAAIAIPKFSAPGWPISR